MRTATTTIMAEPSSKSNRRQPPRQTRTSAVRSTLTIARPLGTAAHDERAVASVAPGFFPGITGFTDSISALPRELVRHYTLLKEVDAKIYGPENALKSLVAEAMRLPAPARKASQVLNTDNGQSTAGYPSATASVSGHNAAHDGGQDNAQGPDMTDLPRRRHFLQLREVLASMLSTLDEKIHVINTASDALNRQLKRCDSFWPEIENEISEETKYGNLNHWAYVDKAAEKKSVATNERARREPHSAHPLATAASIGDFESGRTKVNERKRAHQHESDFEDDRKRHNGPAKGRKPAATHMAAHPSHQATNGTIANKRRKVEKAMAPLPGQLSEKAMSSVFGTNPPINRVGGSPRETPGLDGGRKRGRGGGLTGSNGRRRAGTNVSAANSPLLASSPVIGTFAAPKGANSPQLGPASMQRTVSARNRQNSTTTVPQAPRPPSATSSKQANGIGPVSVVDTLPRGPDIKASKQEESPAEVDPRLGSRTNDRSGPKSDSSTSRHRPPSISTSARANGRASKTNTPMQASFSEGTRPRSGRTNSATQNSFDHPLKRSHKKGAGIAAQRAAAAAVVSKDDDASSVPADDDEDLDGEPRYCYCGGVSYGEMVACDMKGCEKEWFHLDCAGLDRAPTNKEKWYCNDCKKKMRGEVV